ncbi:MAG: hypothetical protein LBV46_00900 [Bacteroidales bacterium]|jgi:acyl-ACP thioesterase|nr:hypothetical protein [Bacteroidales bacterium]
MKATPIREKQINIGSFFVDSRQRLTPNSLLELMQDVAWEHSTSYNVGWEFLQTINLFWALSKMHIKINRLPRWTEEITLRTWGKTPENVIFHRDFEMLDAEGNLLLNATSSWATLAIDTGRVQKLPEEVGYRLPVPPNKYAILEPAPKIQKMEVITPPVFQSVRYSDIDMNQHVNNTKYILWVLNSFDFQFLMENDLSEIIINYISQAKMGDFYAIETVVVAPDHFISLIYSKENREICKVETFWKKGN